MSTQDDAWEGWVEDVSQLCEQNEIPGVAIAMIDGNGHTHTKGFGVRDTGSNQPVTPDTLFHIASTQKSITSMFIARLVDEGLFGWDTPVADIAPQFRLADQRATRQINMRHLLGMSGGIPAAAEERDDIQSGTAEDLFTIAQGISLNSTPGTKFDYSNISYALAGFSGALAAGARWGHLEQDFCQQVRDRIFTPIGMTGATFSTQDARATNNCSLSHQRQYGECVANEMVDVACDALAPSGAARVSVTDMAKFVYTQLNRGVSPLSKQVVSLENLQKTWTPQVEDPNGGAYALGWGVEDNNGRMTLYHEGNFGGFVSFLGLIPELRTGMVILANIDDKEAFINDCFADWLELVAGPAKGKSWWNPFA